MYNGLRFLSRCGVESCFVSVDNGSHTQTHKHPSRPCQYGVNKRANLPTLLTYLCLPTQAKGKRTELWRLQGRFPTAGLAETLLHKVRHSIMGIQEKDLIKTSYKTIKNSNKTRKQIPLKKGERKNANSASLADLPFPTSRCAGFASSLKTENRCNLFLPATALSRPRRSLLTSCGYLNSQSFCIVNIFGEPLSGY